MLSIQLYFIQLVFEIYEVFLNSIPDLIKVDSEILMNENIPHRDNLIPRDVRKLFFEFGFQFVSSLSDDFKAAENGILYPRFRTQIKKVNLIKELQTKFLRLHLL